MEPPDPPPPLRARLASWRGPIGAVLGAGLLGAAVWVVWSQGGVVEQAWNSARHAPPWLIGAALVLPLCSWVFTSMAFCLLSRRYAPVPLGDMTLLIGAAWLLNHLPLRPGMVGRVAFHKKYHDMALRDSVRVMVGAIACSAGSLLMLLGAAAAIGAVDGPALALACLLGPTMLVGALGLVARSAGLSWWAEAWALALRSLDMLAWVGRYAIVFALVGEEVSLGRLVAITAIGQLAMLIPITGNGLGLREWSVGVTLALMLGPGAENEAREQAAAIGLTADLVNRAAETLLAVPVGLACSALLARIMRTRDRSDR